MPVGPVSPTPASPKGCAALVAIGLIVAMCSVCVMIGRSGNNVPVPAPTTTRIRPPSPAVVAQLRVRAETEARAVREGIPAVRALLEAQQLDEASTAVNALVRRLAAAPVGSPPPDQVVETRTALDTVVSEVRGRIGVRDALANARLHVAEEPGSDVLAYDSRLASDASALAAIVPPYRAENLAAIRNATVAVERRRRMFRRQVQAARRAEAERVALSLVCGDRAPVVGGWDGELVGAERYMRQTAHDPGSIDVEHCSTPQLTRRNCWVSTCQVRGRNAFGAMVLNSVTFSVGRAGILSAANDD